MPRSRSSTAERSEYPKLCPYCGAKTAQPIAARTAIGKLILFIRCDACRKEWSEDRPDVPLIARRAPDDDA